MKVILRSRRYGVHNLVKETEVPGAFSDYATPYPDNAGYGDYAINEDKLLDALPEGFLPVAPKRVLVMVEDKQGSTGQTGLTRFMNWAKYFDAYCLNLVTDEDPSPAGIAATAGEEPGQ